MVLNLLLTALVLVSDAQAVVPGVPDEDCDAIADQEPREGPHEAILGSGPQLDGRLLIDRSHGQQQWSIGDFSIDLRNHGWVVVHENTGPLTPELLAQFDILMILAGAGGQLLEEFSSAELASVHAFVFSGGSLWALHESGQDPSAINSVVASFGVAFTETSVRDSTNNEGDRYFWPTIHTFAPHGVFSGVQSYGYYGGCCLQVANPSAALATGDDDTFSLNGVCPLYPAVLAAYASNGRAIFSGDQTPTNSGYFTYRIRQEERQLLYNILDWLLGSGPVAVEPTSWGATKARYR